MNELLGKAQDEIKRLKRALDDCAQETDHWREEVERLHRQIARGCGDETKQTPVANLPSLIENHEFIADLARYAEGLYSEAAVKKKRHFDDATWLQLGDDEKLIEAIEADKVRRIRNGVTARERAQQHFATAPNVLGNILNDDDVSPRHKIESARELRAIAATGPEAAQAADRFVIHIDLGEDQKLIIDKTIAPLTPDEARKSLNDGEIIDATPQKALPASTTEDDWKR